MTVQRDRRDTRDPGASVGVVALGRDRRLRPQIAAIGALALLVVLAGLGLGGPSDDADGPSPSGPARTAAPSGTGVAALPSGDPQATSAAGDCDPLTSEAAPTVRLRSTSGDQSPVLGTNGPTPSTGPGPDPSDPDPSAPVAPTPGSPAEADWTVPGLERGLLLPSGASLILGAAQSACIAAVTVTYDDADAGTPGSNAREPWVVQPRRPTDEVRLGGLPAGDWVVRLDIEFAVPDTWLLSVARTAYFRVVASDAPVLAPSPQVTPAVACGPDPLGSGSPELVLVVDDGAPVAAQAGPDDPIPVEVAFGQVIEVRAIGNVCARGWSIEVSDGLGNAFLQESYPNPVDNPFLAAQNRWTLSQLLIGDSALVASIEFGRQRSGGGVWSLHLTTPGLPTGFASGPDGTVVPILPGCGQYWAQPGSDAFEPCFVQSVPDGLQPLRMEAGGVVRVELVGWSVVSWFARCGEVPESGDIRAEFVTLDGCDLGERQEPDAIAFVPWPGDRLVLVGITAERDGITAYGNYYVRIDAE
ncbi:MAG: hypothetical protein EPO36_11790 [Chloroflexota bacterium]|nr:MAG: hypothetical protein EPO36_11790 [Chloroflexota bacterium]